MFAFPEINHELIPGLGGLKRLEKICGHKTAMEILLQVTILNANKALEIKIVDQVIPSKDCLDYSKQYMQDLIKDRSCKGYSNADAFFSQCRISYLRKKQ